MSAAYVVASFLTFGVLMPLQNVFFPEYPSYASLLFLPHGVRVLTAWLLGWRAVLALLPGVFAVFLYVGGMDAFLPSRLMAMAAAVLVAPGVFALLKHFGHDLFPGPGKPACWSCIMGVGVLTSLIGAALTSFAFSSSWIEYAAFLIGDVFGLFFLMLLLLLGMRLLDRKH